MYNGSKCSNKKAQSVISQLYTQTETRLVDILINLLRATLESAEIRTIMHAVGMPGKTLTVKLKGFIECTRMD
jgi:hypothetical protein